MYEDLAWKSFEKTGSIESFLEYKKLNRINNLEDYNGYIDDDIDEENEERSKT